MDTKIVTAIAGGTADEAADQLIARTRAGFGEVTPAMLIAFASTSQPLHTILARLRHEYPHSCVMGSSSSGEFTEAGDQKGAVALFAVAGDFKVFAGMAIGLRADVEKTVQHAVAELPAALPGYRHRTAILLLDPLAGNGEEATLIASSLLGEGVRLAGGAAGDDLKMQATHVGLNDWAASDALVVAVIFSNAALGVGVCHGHQPLSEPLKVTRAEAATVYEIDGRPAWDVWAEKTRDSAAKRNVDPDKLSEAELGGYLLRYEAGLATGADEYKIRAPLSRGPAGALSFACGIPQGSVIRITESEPERQVQSARTAARRALDQTGGLPVAGALVFDCICRNLILEKDFKTAVHAISDELGGMPLAGFETYGEIALDAGDMSGFHNTTTVVLTFPK
jgi:methyl-accepting chemotaxis protein